MEESNNRGEFQANLAKLSTLRSGGSFKSTLSGRSTPRNSPSFRRLNSSRTPRREGRGSVGGGAQWFRSNRLLLWLLLITLWAYLGFFVQSRWAHSDKKEEFSGFGTGPRNTNSDAEQIQRRDLLASDNSLSANNETVRNEEGIGKIVNVVLAKKENDVPSPRKTSSKKRSRRSNRASKGKARGKRNPTLEVKNSDIEEQEPEIPQTNSTYGLLVGPFGSIEDGVLEWSPQKRTGTCNRKGDFARLVWSRRFILIFHELSMTGAPLSMMELATELLSCGATVSAVVLSKKGGLMSELARRRIKVLEDKADLSFKTAMKADLVIAGSAVCASWIEQYIERFPAGASQVAWWIMENRREYFDRSKGVLDRVKMLVFLSESQSKQWQKWCEEESIKLRSQPEIVPLSINDELAFVAGIPSTLNTPSYSTEKMIEKRKLLRESVRKEMGLTDNDMLVVSLSSINPGKGQLLLLESASSVVEHGQMQDDKKMKKLPTIREGLSTLARRKRIRKLLPLLKDGKVASNDIRSNSLSRRKQVLPNNKGTIQQSLKVLIGSVGSKSNKVDYVKGLLSFLEQHPNTSKSVLWTPATTQVASLYSAADVYVINSQGLGETFGRVTIEAMAFGLPVLGTDAGGTQEIVEHNVTGLLHPVGRPGNDVLAQNLRFLLKNQLVRKQMGVEGRKKVQGMYLKQHMYKKFVEVIVRCMRSK
ncbi:Glycosyl transferase, family 1 [Sesbania bispinosa]|nr:Glycosyl transferase, family 1 [Sesbania bispinosa]